MGLGFNWDGRLRREGIKGFFFFLSFDVKGKEWSFLFYFVKVECIILYFNVIIGELILDRICKF